MRLPVAFGDFILIEPISKGSATSLYLATHGKLAAVQHFCAVKTIKLNDESIAGDVARFIEKARVTLQMNHRNICHTFEVGQVEDFLFVALEHVLGKNLHEVLKRHSERSDCMEPALAIYLMRAVLDALDYAHRFKELYSGEEFPIIHADVTPSNILLSYNGEPKVIDFGPASSKEALPSRASMGDPGYMSPEQAAGRAIDARANQYSVAVILAELLTGRRYYSALSVAQQVRGEYPENYRPPGFEALEPRLRALLDTALAPNPDDRFESCAEFESALAEYQIEYRHRVHGGTIREAMHILFEQEMLEDRVHFGRLARTVERARMLDAQGGAVDMTQTLEVKFRMSSEVMTSDAMSSDAMSSDDVLDLRSVDVWLGDHGEEGERPAFGSLPATVVPETPDDLFDGPTMQTPPGVLDLIGASGSTMTGPPQDGVALERARIPLTPIPPTVVDAFDEDTIVEPSGRAFDSDSGNS